jgi:hypothetical protein
MDEWRIPMSKPALVNVLTKMRRDKQYRAVVKTDPDTALLRVDLTAEERAALTVWDTARLEAIGVGPALAHAALFGANPFGASEPVAAGAAGSGASGCG